MHSIITYASNHSFDYKTNKSIYNILNGKKSHQTFFDACSQQLLSLYHSLPKLKYPSFERFLDTYDNQNTDISIHPRYTYDSMIQTFSCIQLLIQTITHFKNNHLNFIPITQQITVQSRVKQIYSKILEQNLVDDFEKEIEQIFHFIDEKCSNNCLIHYYLQGYEEPMYTRQQVSLIEGIPVTKLFVLELNNLVQMMFALENDKQFPILTQTIILPTLLNKTTITYHQLLKELSMDEVAVTQNVKINTIEDHVLELFIKGYFSEYQTFVNGPQTSEFIAFYDQNRGQRLKLYKEEFDRLTYFQIKLLIVGIERGELIA